MLDRSPVIVIGSGAGGLFSALFLARLGRPVTVLEQHTRPGGLLRSYSREGFDCPVGVHYVGALAEGQLLRRIFDSLGLSERVPVERMGADGFVDRYLLERGQPARFDMPEGLEAFEAALGDTFGGERSAIDEIMAELRWARDTMHRLDLIFDKDAGLGALPQLRPLGERLDELGCSTGLRRVLSVPSAWFGVPIRECPTTFHHMVLASYLESSWRLACTGSQLAEAMVARLEELGGRVHPRARVEHIRVTERRVRGVTLRGGEQLDAQQVVAAIHPRRVLELLPDEAVKPAYRNRVRQLRDTSGVFCVQAVVPAADNPERAHNVMVHRAADDGRDEVLFYQLRRTHDPDWSLLCAMRPSSLEEWGAPGGSRRPPGYTEAKQRAGEQLIDRARQFWPPLSGARIIDTYTPLTLRDWTGSAAAYGVSRSTEQRFQTAMLHRTAVEGLTLSGQSVLAPGVVGTAIGALRTLRVTVGLEELRRGLEDLRA